MSPLNHVSLWCVSELFKVTFLLLTVVTLRLRRSEAALHPDESRWWSLAAPLPLTIRPGNSRFPTLQLARDARWLLLSCSPAPGVSQQVFTPDLLRDQHSARLPWGVTTRGKQYEPEPGSQHAASDQHTEQERWSDLGLFYWNLQSWNQL